MSAAASVTLAFVETAVRRPDVTQAVTRGAARLLAAMGHGPLTEVRLPNGRRADVMALGAKGELIICEVKSSREDFTTDRKWVEYAPFCDAFYFAVAPEFPQVILPEHPGLIVADGFGGAVVREPVVTPLAPARRKALTIAFGRLAALRATGCEATV
ncbi:DNA repair putative endonuclease MmcB [Brevundimonas sp. 2R-24]|uniref:DNA repair putative endonuclease MmcB n=1 Tax=Peiella sedimenti TaxID=3061083 RepID=A0ABT8SLM0_9CAUL|nr:DNA repair putative endonuclease MmcB [Caulobacteraceae bacterium XZ-24]